VSELTRLGFVKSSAAAAAGMTVFGALLAEDASAQAGEEPVVAYVSDPRKGEISVMRGDREVKVRDKKLAARIYGATS
jgi:hypothetical protein